ncbi:S24 family peptidase [Paludisphaera sp.]|uniref:S24 family peptidase n=1 Tax=Paludisphaera sp. TaxID=2017432 RepID=UPI00301C7146
MARRKTLPESLRAKLELAERLTALRLELFGERGGPEMARKLGIPVRTWYNYEGGVTVPAEVILKVIELTSAEPGWLLHGKGPKFQPEPRRDHESEPSRPSRAVGALLRTALEILEGNAPPELGIATARFVEAERAVGGRPDGLPEALPDERATDAPPASPRLDRDMLRADGGRGEREWLDARRDGRCLPTPDDSMAPVLARGTLIAYAPAGEPPASLDGRMVVARVDGEAIVRWFEDRGDHGVLRAEDPRERPVRVDLDADEPPPIRRVLWIEAAR